MNPPRIPTKSSALKASPLLAERRGPEDLAAADTPSRKFTFYLAVALVFMRCSLVQETLTYELHFNLYLLYVVGVLTVLGLIVSGSLLRPFKFRPAYYWFGYAIWIALAVPFSVWRGESLNLVESYWRTDVVMLFAIGGVVSTWRECRTVYRAIALACVVSLITVRIFGRLDESGRMHLLFSTVSNSNDYAAHLLMLLPSLLWVASVAKSFVMRLAAVATFGYGVYAVLASSSRGALIALTAGTIYFLFSAPRKQRVMAVVLVPLLAVIAFSFMPRDAIQRIFSFSASSSSSSEDAIESSDIRSHVLKDSISYAIHNPIFGVGPGNFSTVEGTANRRFWLEAHNTFTQVASECGIPAFIFFLGGIGSSFLIFRRIGRKFAENPEASEFTYAAFCMRLTIVMFCTAITFLNFAYSFYLPMIGSIAIAMAYIAETWPAQEISVDPNDRGGIEARLRRPAGLSA
ncbi:MAG: O-antigen ligase family protein [Candidatus Acidiferrales bacterium]